MQNIEALKSLTQTTYDSVEGYKKAIAKVDNPTLKRALQSRLDARERTLSDMNTVLVDNGGDRVDSSSLSASMHQTWLIIADTFERDTKAAVERVEEGEDYLAREFQDAMNDNAFEGAIEATLKSAYSEIRESERFSDMLEKQYA